MIFIIRSGVQVLADHPRLYWTRHSTPGKDWFRIQKPVPDEPLWTAKQDSIGLPGQVGLPGIRHSIGLARWWDLGTDVLWLLNGVIFYVLLFATSQWRHLVPTSWAVFPNAVSVLIQYLSLRWPTDQGWVAYNSLQLLAYFVTVFVAAPLALITGLGMSPALSTRFRRISRMLSVQTARSLHFLVLVWFRVLHRDARHVCLHHRPAQQPQPHLRRSLRRQLGRLLGVRDLDGRRHRRLGLRYPVHPAPPSGGAAGRLRVDRPGATLVRARPLHPR
jgi:thiosulfate reductase cytochrome b subunit